MVVSVITTFKNYQSKVTLLNKFKASKIAKAQASTVYLL
jgi:hypothetical protein